MHPSYPYIFSILHQSLFPENTCSDTICDATILSEANSSTPQQFINTSSLSEPDWDFIYSEMQFQTVSSLVQPWLKSNTLPDNELQQKWMTSCLQQQAKWIRMMHTQDNLVSLMEQHNIPCVIIKGAAAMVAYPQPALRAIGDIDFLVKRKDYERAAVTLKNNGYQPEFERDQEHHLGFIKDGITIELHKRLATIKDNDEYMLSLFENGIDNRIWHSMGNNRFPSLPDDLNGLVLLFHINQHIRSGLGLRHIIDWMMYVNQNNIDGLLPTIRITGMDRLAITVTIMCQKYLGLNIVIEDTDDYPYEDLMEFIINKGNFGFKGGEKEKISSVSLVTTNPLRLFSRLQKGGLMRWKATEKYRWLRPFAWIYQTGAIIHEIFVERITIVQLFKSHRIGTEQRNLIRNLGLDIDKNKNQKSSV